MKITKSIRFKLTLWYSLLLLALSSVFILFVNVIVTDYYRDDPIQNSLRVPKMLEHLKEFSNEQREAVREIREQDLNKIRKLSVYSLFPLALFSFGGGYLISGYMLSPIKKLNKAATKINAQNLNTEIEHEDVGDEISELIDNFNKMTSRLHGSFESQKQFVENASHELKTPLAVIQTNLDLAQEDKKITKQEIRALIKTANKSTDFMNRLIEDLLLLSVIENHIEKTETNLKVVVKNSIEQLSQLANKKRVKMNLNSDKGNFLIKGNSVLLQRAIMNILENAIKYSPKNSMIKISLQKNNEGFQLSVKDQGLGIPKGEQTRIFERFYRIDKSRSRKTGGVGLGLSIAKKIIDLHGGEIKLSSKNKKGCTFKIFLSQNSRVWNPHPDCHPRHHNKFSQKPTNKSRTFF